MDKRRQFVRHVEKLLVTKDVSFDGMAQVFLKLARLSDVQAGLHYDAIEEGSQKVTLGFTLDDHYTIIMEIIEDES